MNDRLRKKLLIYREDPALFAKEAIGFIPDKWQEEALKALARGRFVSVRSGQGVGKTGLEAAALLWFLACYPNSRVVATAPTRRQLNDVLWTETAKWLENSPLLNCLFHRAKSYIYMRGAEKRWFATARTAAKPENMQGFHEDNQLFIVDEASGVPDDIMEAIYGTLSGPNNRLLLCGNPTRTSGFFYDSHTKDRGMYYTMKVSARDSARTNKENIASLERRYGADSNVVRVRVDGEFPLQDDDVFIPLHLVEDAVRREYSPSKEPQEICIGADIARFGGDSTVIGYRLDEKAVFEKKTQGQDTMRTADDIAALYGRLAHRYRSPRPIYVKIDDGGVGGGVTDRLRQLKRTYPERFRRMEIIPVKFGAPIRHRHYADSTTYMMAALRERLEEGRIVLPDDSELAAQLSSRRYFITAGGRIKAESKDDMKKRGLPSPDEADCLLLLCLPVKDGHAAERKNDITEEKDGEKNNGGRDRKADQVGGPRSGRGDAETARRRCGGMA